MAEYPTRDFENVLTEQFTQSIKAIAELTQSIHDLQAEVEDHSGHILHSKTEVIVLKDKLATLTRLVQGEGLTDSITTAVVELNIQVKALQQWQRDFRDDKRDGKTTNVTLLVMIVGSVATILATIFSTIIPWVIPMIQKGS